MGLFQSSAASRLDLIIEKMNMNMSNNYKDNAQADYQDLEAAYRQFVAEGKLKTREVAKYDSILGIYKEKLKGYTHKDQKPFWT